MFYYLDGTVTMMEPGIAVVDIGGVGYCCFVSANTQAALETGKKCRLYTYCNIKEDAFDIYGFADISEKRCFTMLLTVSGVGPKAALSILSSNTPESLMMAIATENEKAITSAAGVGKRIAQRVILELKDKIAKENLNCSKTVPVSAGVSGQKLSDAVSALTVLGYSQNEISAAINGLDTTDMSVEDIIRQVLKSSAK